MRLVAVAASLIVGLAAPPVLSQPAPPVQSVGWRTAAAAALAFGHAEGKRLAMARFSIPVAPTTKKDADAALDDLDRVAKDARDAYLFVQRYGSPFWTAAAEIRIGDTLVCQAEKIASVPVPPQITQGMSPKAKATLLALLDGLVEPLREEAAHYWKRTSTGNSSFWAARARSRLAGMSRPDC